MRNTTQAFTRIELLAVCTALALLALVVAPALATNKTDADRAACFNNLRQIGRAVQMWGADHQNDPPWRTPVFQGGTQPESGLTAKNAWLEFAVLSNEVATPRLLVCPADGEAKVASEFSNEASRGYMATGFRGLATSYFINLHTLSATPVSIVCGDRNLRLAGPAACVFGLNNASTFDLFGLGSAGWTNAVHGQQGHILRMDGSVLETTSRQFLAAFILSEGNNDNASPHLLKAR